MREQVDAAYLREQAERCRRLADGIDDRDAVATLRKMAEDYELRAAALENPFLMDGVPHPSLLPPLAE